MTIPIKTWRFARLFTLIGGTALVVIAGTPLQGQVSPIEVLDGRPLARAILELENRHGWLVTYEDPFYDYPNDLEDVTVLARRGSSIPPGAPKLLVPRNKLFRFEYDNFGSTRPQEVLPALVKNFNSSGLSDEFRLVRQGAVYHVVPAKSLNAKGTLTNRQSRLDTRVTVDDRERTAYEMLAAVLKQVSATLGSEVGLGSVPVNLLQSQKVHGGAQQEMARDVIVRTLDATAPNISWQLFCDPGTLKLCAFNLHLVSVFSRK